MAEDIYKRTLEQRGQEKTAREEEVKRKFDFQKDLAEFIEKEYPKHLKIAHERVASSGDLNQAVAQGDLNTLEKIRKVIEASLSYLGEKIKDNEEGIRYLMKLRLLLEEADNRLGKTEK